MEINWSQIDLAHQSEIPVWECIALGCWVDLFFSLIHHLVGPIFVASVCMFSVARDTWISTFTTLNIIAIDLLTKVHRLLSLNIIFFLSSKEVKFMLVCRIWNSDSCSLWWKKLALSCGWEKVVAIITTHRSLVLLVLVLILLETNGRVFKHWEFSLWHPRVTCSHQLQA